MSVLSNKIINFALNAKTQLGAWQTRAKKDLI